MATFLEIKELLKNILGIEMEMDEQCDIIVPNEIDGRDKLEIYTNTYREVALRLDTPIRMLSEIESEMIRVRN